MYIDSLFSRRRYAHYIFDHVGILSTFYSLLYIIGVLCSCVYIHICVVACIHVGMQWTEVDVWCLPQCLSTLFFVRFVRQCLSLTLELCDCVCYSQLSWLSKDFRGSTCLISPVLRLYGCTTMLRVLHRRWGG